MVVLGADDVAELRDLATEVGGVRVVAVLERSFSGSQQGVDGSGQVGGVGHPASEGVAVGSPAGVQG